jgi:hypothetical protein
MLLPFYRIAKSTKRKKNISAKKKTKKKQFCSSLLLHGI